MPTIRPETPADYAAVRDVNERAFGGTMEADLVDVLRRTVETYASLVAVEEGRVIGHIFFSPVEIVGEATGERADLVAMGLAPMAVLPEHQGRGVGAALVRAGLRACKAAGSEAVVVLGHPTYYPRFGFEPAASKGLRCEYEVSEPVFMVLELSPGALEGRRGTVKYHAAFGRVE